MKKKQKLSAMFLASVITAGTVSSLSVGARNLTGYDKEEFAKIIAKSDHYIPPSENYRISDIYLTKRETPTSSGTYDYYLMGYGAAYCNPNKVNIKINKSDFDNTVALIREILPEAVVAQSEEADGLYSVSIAGFSEEKKLRFEESYNKEITLNQANSIYNKLSKIADIQSFDYEKVFINPLVGESHITDFDLNSYNGKDDEKIKQLEQYIANTNLKCHVEKNSLCVTVIPDEEISAADLSALSQQIQDDLGIEQFIFNRSLEYDVNSTLIDLHNNIKGDANDDGNLALSDAITIMQAVGNPDKYKLTAQGEYNADIAGDFDGITNLDALTIQRKLLKLE